MAAQACAIFFQKNVGICAFTITYTLTFEILSMVNQRSFGIIKIYRTFDNHQSSKINIIYLTTCI